MGELKKNLVSARPLGLGHRKRRVQRAGNQHKDLKLLQQDTSTRIFMHDWRTRRVAWKSLNLAQVVLTVSLTLS